jgi:hypothetical protein
MAIFRLILDLVKQLAKQEEICLFTAFDSIQKHAALKTKITPQLILYIQINNVNGVILIFLKA